MQKVDVSILYDSLELSFSTGDNTSILNFNNNDIVPYLNLAALAVDVYNKTDVDIGLNIKAGKTNTQLKYDVDVFLSSLQAGIDRRVLINAVDVKGKFDKCYL